MHAGGERSRLDQPKSLRLLELRPVRCPGAERDRVDHQPVLVDQSATDELTGQVRATDFEVAVELTAQVLEHVTHVAAHQPGVVRSTDTLRVSISLPIARVDAAHREPCAVAATNGDNEEGAPDVRYRWPGVGR